MCGPEQRVTGVIPAKSDYDCSFYQWYANLQTSRTCAAKVQNVALQDLLAFEGAHAMQLTFLGIPVPWLFWNNIRDPVLFFSVFRSGFLTP